MKSDRQRERLFNPKPGVASYHKGEGPLFRPFRIRKTTPGVPRSLLLESSSDCRFEMIEAIRDVLQLQLGNSQLVDSPRRRGVVRARFPEELDGVGVVFTFNADLGQDPSKPGIIVESGAGARGQFVRPPRQLGLGAVKIGQISLCGRKIRVAAQNLLVTGNGRRGIANYRLGGGARDEGGR